MDPVLRALREQIEHGYHVVAKFVAPLTLGQARFTRDDGRPSIAWLVGHLDHCVATVPESVCGAPPVVAARVAAHGQPHWGVATDVDWARLRAEFAARTADTLRRLEGLSDAALDLPLTVPVHPAFQDTLTTRRRFLQGHVFHVAYHAGQIGALRAAQSLNWDDAFARR